jgi:hypothetical protein
MSSKLFRVVLFSFLGVSVMPGCRSNKSVFTYAPPQPALVSLASVEPQSDAVPSQSTEAVQPAADSTYSPPEESLYPASDYSPTPSKSSPGCSSGCCSG